METVGWFFGGGIGGLEVVQLQVVRLKMDGHERRIAYSRKGWTTSVKRV